VLHLARGDHNTPEFQKRSITGRVPAIEHTGFWLTESQAIVEYLEETFTPPEHPRALPSQPRVMARARQILAWLRSDLQNLRKERSTETMFYERRVQPLTRPAQADANKLVRVVEQLLPEGATTVFPKWSLVDADLAFMLARLHLNHDPLPDRLKKYVESNWKRPSIHAYIAKRRPGHL
ncbi:MAG TPA: glutathione transferase, partial [Polyangiaceae bacterium]|nr:glutathione transferase [Polyangiaceae bacterium]